MKTLDLVLKHKWYDMIACGEKKEEYREIKPHWFDRLIDCRVPKTSFLATRYFGLDNSTPQIHNLKEDFDSEWLVFKEFDAVRFHRGYTSTTMTYEIESISIGKGNHEWGAEPGKDYFVIKLGKRLKETEE